MPTTNADLGENDPALDHTPSGDNGVGGVVLGGLAPATLHDDYWLESPAFDTSGAAGSVVLGFYRWLNSDFDPWMVNRVEIGSTSGLYDIGSWNVDDVLVSSVACP